MIQFLKCRNNTFFSMARRRAFLRHKKIEGQKNEMYSKKT